MGLGLFIAKTLLERSGAELHFANGSDRTSRADLRKLGAVVEVVWPRSKIDAVAGETPIPTGENTPITI
jgi:two-component system sensor histidine kinase RegB